MKKLFLFTTFALCSMVTWGQWTEANTNLPTNSYISAFAEIGNTVFVNGGNASLGGIYSSSNSGSTWNLTGSSGVGAKSFAVDGADLYTANYGGVYHSSNNGVTWSTLSNGITNVDVRSVAVCNSNIFAGVYGQGMTPSGIFKSSDNGANWSTCNTGLPTTSISFDKLIVNGNNIFAGTDGHGVYLSSDNGGSWTEVNTGLTNTFIRSFAVSGSTLYAGTGDGVFYTTNNGGSWTAISTGLFANTLVDAIEVNGTDIFIGTNGNGGGIYHSNNNGTNWTNVSVGLPSNTAVKALVVSGSSLLAGVDAYGVWKRPLSEIGSATNVQDITENVAFSISPNPSSKEVVIEATLLKRGSYVITVTDISGRIVHTQNNILEVGSNKIALHFEGKGIYFVSLQSGATKVERKVIVE